jgi:hypothetical protein
MAQHRHEAHERGALDGESPEAVFDTPEDPTHSETRTRVPESPPEVRRASMRPTPFGPPRALSSPPQRMLSSPPPTSVPPPPSAPPLEPSPLEPQSTGVASKRPSVPPEAPARAPESPTPSVRTRMPAKPMPQLGGESPPSFRADVEELLPLPDATQSLPRIPLAAVFPLGTELEKKAEGRSLFQVLAFAFVLLASMVPVLRYTGVLGSARPVVTKDAPAVTRPSALQASALVERPVAPAPLAPPRVEPKAADPVSATVARIEATLPSDADAASEVLVGEASRALDAGEERLAETLLARALKLDDGNPRAAYALARIRLAQNNLEGAEGWVLVALRKLPKRAEYHTLYADILAKQGHASHARRERRKARHLRD